MIDHYINLERFYDTQGLQSHREEILLHMTENKTAYRRCYHCLGALGALENDIHELIFTEEVAAKLSKRAKGIIGRELHRAGNEAGNVTHRFLSAVSCQGRLTLWDTVSSGFHKVYELQDTFGLAHELLVPILAAATAQGYNVVACPSPLAPDRLEHLLIPALGLAFVTSNKEQPYSGSRPYRRLHLDAIYSTREEYIKHRARFAKKVSAALLDGGLEALKSAKAAHDTLENLYNPYVDFSGVYAEADALAAQLFPGCLIANQ